MRVTIIDKDEDAKRGGLFSAARYLKGKENSVRCKV